MCRSVNLFSCTVYNADAIYLCGILFAYNTQQIWLLIESVVDWISALWPGLNYTALWQVPVCEQLSQNPVCSKIERVNRKQSRKLGSLVLELLIDKKIL